jgi:hypothetical protein
MRLCRDKFFELRHQSSWRAPTPARIPRGTRRSSRLSLSTFSRGGTWLADLSLAVRSRRRRVFRRRSNRRSRNSGLTGTNA